MIAANSLGSTAITELLQCAIVLSTNFYSGKMHVTKVFSQCTALTIFTEFKLHTIFFYLSLTHNCYAFFCSSSCLSLCTVQSEFYCGLWGEKHSQDGPETICIIHNDHNTEKKLQ